MLQCAADAASHCRNDALPSRCISTVIVLSIYRPQRAERLEGRAVTDNRYPEIEPYEQGMLDVGDGNLVY